MILIVIVVVAICVALHYEMLHQMTRIIPKLNFAHRSRIAFGVIIALVAHSLGICVFGFCYYVLHRAGGWGDFDGSYDGSLLDSIHFSATTFTTLGFGDIAPHGELRLLTGVESLTGLVLITWTASFLYIEMARYWDNERD